MPRKTNKRRNKKNRTKKQKPLVMVGCSKKGKKSCSKVFSTLISLSKNKSCTNCGPNCYCGPNCKCPHPCPGNCYLNRRNKKQRGGSDGCGPCSCPLAPLSTNEMKMFGGYSGHYPPNLIPHANGQPVIISPPQKGYVPILGTAQNGGSCGTCGQMSVIPQSGGNFFKQIGAMPGPKVGNPWSGDLKWPGMNGVGADRNYLANYGGIITKDPQQQMSMNDAGYLTKNSMVGGYRYNKKSHSSSKTGGSLIPQDLVNLGRDFSYNFKTAYNALNGYKAPVDPAPYKGQLTGALNNNRFIL